MKIPLLILCLAVVYGACQTYGEENFNLTEKIENNGDYKLDYANVPLERFLSRHRRASLLSPITAPLNMALRLAGFDNGIISVVNSIISTVMDFTKISLGAFFGQECPKVEKSLTTVWNIITQPTETIKTIVCYIFKLIGIPGRLIMQKMFEMAKKFFRNVFLPGMHTTLNAMDKKVDLPPQISGMIKTFNMFYKFLQMVGYVPK